MGDISGERPRFSIWQLEEIVQGRETPVRAIGIELSRYGIRCATDVRLEPSTVVSLSIELLTEAGSHTLKCEGLVSVCEEAGTGYVTDIVFGPISEQDVAYLTGSLFPIRAKISL